MRLHVQSSLSIDPRTAHRSIISFQWSALNPNPFSSPNVIFSVHCVACRLVFLFALPPYSHRFIPNFEMEKTSAKLRDAIIHLHKRQIPSVSQCPISPFCFFFLKLIFSVNDWGLSEHLFQLVVCVVFFPVGYTCILWLRCRGRCVLVGNKAVGGLKRSECSLPIVTLLTASHQELCTAIFRISTRVHGLVSSACAISSSPVSVESRFLILW